jgi:hypothetical protein
MNHDDDSTPNVKRLFPHLSKQQLEERRDTLRTEGAKCDALIDEIGKMDLSEDVGGEHLETCVRLRRQFAREERKITLVLKRRAHVARKRARGFEPTLAVLRKYGLTADTFHAMRVAQQERCFICMLPFAETDGISIDHDHSRTDPHACGLLCHKCNRAIGLFDESTATLSRAIAYLERTRALHEAEGVHRVRHDAQEDGKQGIR